MSDRELLTDLRKGATICLDNARRLVNDAENLFYKNKYLSCFLLSELALEEMAKGFKLLEKDEKKEEFARKEWEDWTQGAKAHFKKLKYVHQVDDEWLEKVLKLKGISYPEFSKGLLKNLPKVKDINDYREKISKAYYDFRLDTLYVNYDFEKKQWIDPRVLAGNFAVNPSFSFQGLVWAKHLLAIFEARL